MSQTLSPAELHKILDVSPCVTLTFASERKLFAYRRSVYTVNSEGHYRYRTARRGLALDVFRLE